MDLRQYWMMYGTDELARLANDAGTTRAYVQQLSWGYRYPSTALAERLVEASNGELSLDEVLFKMRREKPDKFRPPRGKAA